MEIRWSEIRRIGWTLAVFFLNYGIKAMESLAVDLNSNGCIPRNQFIADDAFLAPPDAHISLRSWVKAALLLELSHSLLLLAF